MQFLYLVLSYDTATSAGHHRKDTDYIATAGEAISERHTDRLC
jgi:hypothetical protein